MTPPIAGTWRFVGRQRESAILEAALARSTGGSGGLFLVAGDAGAGKTTLVESVLSSADVHVLRGGAHGDGVPYGPLKAALRDHLHRSSDDAVSDMVSTAPTLGLVMPELGSAPSTVMAEHISLAIRQVFEHLARQRPTVVFLDDLQWADAATLQVMLDWTTPVFDLPLLVIGAYRSDELPRQHPLRRLRSGLRRVARDRPWQVRLGPLDPADSTLLVRRVLGDDVAPEVVDVVHRRAHGLPFYVEELATSIAEADESVTAGSPSEVVPESVRDAVMQQVARLSEPARAAAEVAAAGSPIRLDVLTDLAEKEEAIEELFDVGLLVEVPHEARDVGGSGRAAFRHALVGEALYAAIPWTRRRRHHAALARALEIREEPPAMVAAHWDKAHRPERARPLLLAAAEGACRVHAYRDAKGTIDRALALWPPGEDEDARLAVVDRLGECAERCGELTDAVRAWEEVAGARRSAGEQEALARVERRLAGVYELLSDWPRALAARSVAVEAFARAGLTADAATEGLAAAAHLQAAGDVTGALQLVQAAWIHIDDGLPEASPASAGGMAGLRARAMGLEGSIRAKLGEASAGIDLGRKALEMALESDMEGLAAEVYYLYADALEMATDYPAALDTMSEGYTYCRSRGLDADAHVCLACLTPALRHTGQWDRALEVGQEVLATSDAPEVARMVAAGEVGLVLVNRGKPAQGRRHLARAAAFARVYELFGLEVEAAWGLARADELDGDHDRAAERLRELSVRCLAREERHYSVAALRWAATFFGRRRLHGELGACTDALAHIAAATGTAEATGALAHALGESALLEGDARRAADQFERALELLGAVNLPPEYAETQVRAGIALAATGDRGTGVDRLVGAYHTARALGARPLAAIAIEELDGLGEDVQHLLGRRAARDGGGVDLTPREREVLRFMATGRTNRQIAGELFLSPRTVDMHVRNLLAKLGCRTRTEAVRRAGELALLEVPAP